MIEEWVKHPSLNYFISSYGRVKNSKGLIMKQYICNGYKRIKLVNDGIKKNYYVHRLIAETFIPKINVDYVVHHIDHDKLNNWVHNLEWCHYQTNLLYEREKLFNE